MSRPQEPHRPFFPFGNPFRAISPKGSKLSSKVIFLLGTFEDSLADRLQKLTPKSDDDILGFSWMELAMKLLCETHNDVKTLIKELGLPVSDWEVKWLDMYLDISVKLLDICNVFSSELSQFSQSNLILRCALHNLESTSSNQFVQACSSLDRWNQLVGSRTSRDESCCTILDGLKESSDLLKVKNSSKGEVLMRAMYGVQVETLFICSVLASAFSGSSKMLLNLNVADTYRWAQAFNDLQKNVNMVLKKDFSSGRSIVLKDLEAVYECVKILHPMIQDGLDVIKVKELQSLVIDLRRKSEKLSQGVDHLTKEVDDFFHIVLSGRDALLSDLRASGTLSEQETRGQFTRRL